MITNSTELTNPVICASEEIHTIKRTVVCSKTGVRIETRTNMMLLFKLREFKAVIAAHKQPIITLR